MFSITKIGAGGTLVQLLQELEARGANQENIRVITAVIAAQACNYLAKNKFESKHRILSSREPGSLGGVPRFS
jgi:uracil phosphoribosyltransferase